MKDVNYIWVQGLPDHNGSYGGCNGCDFRPLSTGIKCSTIPCQKHPGLVAKIVKQSVPYRSSP